MLRCSVRIIIFVYLFYTYIYLVRLLHILTISTRELIVLEREDKEAGRGGVLRGAISQNFVLFRNPHLFVISIIKITLQYRCRKKN